MKRSEVDPLIVIKREVLSTLPDNVRSLIFSNTVCEGSELYIRGVESGVPDEYLDYLSERGSTFSNQ